MAHPSCLFFQIGVDIAAYMKLAGVIMHASEIPYPYILRTLFETNGFENIVDSNILTPYIPVHAKVPPIEDPRRTQASHGGTPRHPAYVKSTRINQIFNYIGFVRRMNKKEYAKYLPILFGELNRFLSVVEGIVYTPAISVSTDIFEELDEGLRNFFEAYRNRPRNQGNWIEDIWKQQKIYLERIDTFLKTMEMNGQVFDLKTSSLHDDIVDFCRTYFHDMEKDPPGDTDIRFVANCCAKAARDNAPKTIWSGDRHITRIMRALYNRSSLTGYFPQIYLRANYSRSISPSYIPRPDRIAPERLH